MSTRSLKVFYTQPYVEFRTLQRTVRIFHNFQFSLLFQRILSHSRNFTGDASVVTSMTRGDFTFTLKVEKEYKMKCRIMYRLAFIKNEPVALL